MDNRIIDILNTFANNGILVFAAWLVVVLVFLGFKMSWDGKQALQTFKDNIIGVALSAVIVFAAFQIANWIQSMIG